MAQPLPQEALDTALHPSQIAKQAFSVERRGYSQIQVKSYLEAVAASLRDAQRREAEMRGRVGKAVRRAERAETELKTQHQLHAETQQDRQVGDEVTLVLQAAQTAAKQRLEEAADERAAIIDEAETQAADLRDAAGKVLGKRTAEAEAEAQQIISKAQARAKAIVDSATLEGQKIRQQAITRLNRARKEAEHLVAEADEARCQILEDMERKRHRARSQVERLKVGRDRLIQNYEVVGRTLEQVTTELRTSMKEAKVSADSAGRMAARRPLASRDALIAEMEQSGRVTSREKPKSVQDSPALPTRSKVTTEDTTVTSKDKLAAPQNRKTKPVQKRRRKLSAKPTAKTLAKPTAKRSTKPKAKPVSNLKPPTAPTLKPSDRKEAVSAANQPRPHERVANTLQGPKVKQANDQRTLETAGLETLNAKANAQSLAESRLDPEVAALHDQQLTVIDLGSEIESVSAMGAAVELTTVKQQARSVAVKAIDDAAVSVITKALSAEKTVTSTTEVSLFAQLRATVTETPADVMVPDVELSNDLGTVTDHQVSTTTDVQVEPVQLTTKELLQSLASEIDDLVTGNSVEIERKMRRVLAKEQNIALASIRKKNSEAGLVDSIGSVDAQLAQYVSAVGEELAATFEAGYRSAFVKAVGGSHGKAPDDIHIPLSQLPAAAIEEVVETELVCAIRERLEQFDRQRSSDGQDTESPVDSREILREVRDFYREVRSDVITKTARRLVRLCATAGACSL